MNINRRDFVKLAGYTGTGLSFGLTACSNAAAENSGLDYDSYGGWKGKKLTKTGYFHTEHDDKRWWFVSPEGYAFLSFGVNHYHEDWWTQDYNREYWLDTFGALEAGDKQWFEGFRKIAREDLKRLGINTLGMHTNAAMLTDKPKKAVVPYLRAYKPIVLDHYRHPKPEVYLDIFAQEFRKLSEETAKKVAGPYINDPMLLGYCMSDCPIFTDTDVRSMGGSATWPRILRNLGSNAPGKQAYLEEIKSRYSNIAAFNTTYETAFTSWQNLADAENWRSNSAPANSKEKEDNEAFMLKCVDRYYSVSKAALHSVDPNHLFFGDKLNGNTDNMEKVLDIAARYVDVILYQYYNPWPDQKALLDKLAPRVDIPFLNGDTGFSVPDEMMPNPYGPHARDQAQRAEWLLECCEGAFARPEFVGWHMCGMIDTWSSMPGKENFQHQGLMTVTGEFYPEMETGVKDISTHLYQIATKN